MAEAKPAEPARLIVGALSGFPEAWRAARAQLVERFGPIDIEAGPWPFTLTDYYADEMGADLSRWFVSFAQLIGQHEIAEIKHATNYIEADVAAGDWPVPRPVNLDPGYVTQGKLVLATAKDHAHRIAVSKDMYAQVTLTFTAGRFQPLEWTYRDYQQESYIEFFTRVREALREEMG